MSALKNFGIEPKKASAHELMGALTACQTGIASPTVRMLLCHIAAVTAERDRLSRESGIVHLGARGNPERDSMRMELVHLGVEMVKAEKDNRDADMLSVANEIVELATKLRDHAETEGL